MEQELVSVRNPDGTRSQVWRDFDIEDGKGTTPPVTSRQVNAERDRRVDLGLTVNIGGTDYTFQFDAKSRENISGAATLAGFAVAGGALAGNYLWHGGTQPFSWILADNSVIQIDAPTMFAIGQAAANRVSLFTFAARTIKELNPIPLNYTADSYWP